MKKPTPHQTFLILSMYFGTTPEEREPDFKDGRVKALAPVQLRTELVNAHILRIGKRERRGFVALGEEAEDFVMKNLGAPLPRTQLAAPVLSRVLARVRELLETGGHSLAEFAGTKTVLPPQRAIHEAEQAIHEAEQAIRDAYLALTHGEKRRRVHLADLRRTVSVSDQILNDALLSMQTAGQVILYKLDNTAEISAEDERAALYIADQPRHIVYLEA